MKNEKEPVRGPRTVATNRKARHEYFIEEVYEAGIVLTGTEIKSVRAGKVSLQDGFVMIKGSEAWLLNVHIAHYEQGNRFNHVEVRDRKLLLNRREIAQLLFRRHAAQLHDRAAARLSHRARPGQGRDRRRPRQAAARQARQHRRARERAQPAPRAQRGLAVIPPMPDPLHLPHGDLELPAFLPDATLGVVRAVDSVDVANCGIHAVVMNTFHLMQHPGSSTVQALGGLHRMSGWTGPIVTDSGGFQAWSLISENPRFGTITEDGITVRPEGQRPQVPADARKVRAAPSGLWRRRRHVPGPVHACGRPLARAGGGRAPHHCLGETLPRRV